MPLYKTLSPNKDTTIKIWKISETYKDLMQAVDLKPENLNRVLKMKSELHQRGFLSVRKLLQLFGYSDFDLFYNADGKPFLKDGRQISITHSFNFSAVGVSDSIIGIDIEKQRPKIIKIADKFVGYEFNYLNKKSNDYIRKLTVIWGAKESLFKLYTNNGLSFKQDTLVIPFTIHDKSTTAWINLDTYKKRYQISFLEFEGFTCAYAIP